MRNILKFFSEAQNLKKMPRTGWVLMRVKKPETIAEHIFRVMLASWLLGQEVKIDTGRAIKIALCHDLCEVYAGDRTPSPQYYSIYKTKSVREFRKNKEILGRWLRLSRKQKEQWGAKKFEIEKKSLLRLLKFVSPSLAKEIFSFWLDYEKKISQEGKFVRQVDRLETLLQSIEYFGTGFKKGGKSWWEGAEEIIEEPFLLKFLHVIEEYFYHKKYHWQKKEEKKRLTNILKFLIETNKFKKIARRGWVLRGIKNPETIAGHIFIFSLMALVFSKEKEINNLNLEKVLKMIICHELPAIYLGDVSPYDYVIKGKNKREKKEILKKWIRFSIKEKMKIFYQEYKQGKKALKKLTAGLSFYLKKEILHLWEEFKTKNSPEARFVNQIKILANLFQALHYWQKNKKFPIQSWWEWAFEVADNEMTFKFLEELKKKFRANIK